MSVSFKIDTRQFNAVLKRAVAGSRRAAVDVVNGHAMAVAAAAIDKTEKANRDQIAHILGQTGNELVYTKKGDRLKKRSKGRAIVGENSLAARIVNSRRRDYAGDDFMLWGNALAEAARKLIASRQRAVGFVKSGWISALKAMAPFVRGRKRYRDRSVKAVGQPKGGATPARAGTFGHVVTAKIENTALIASGGKYQSKGRHNPLPVAQRGLQAALNAEVSEMERHMKEKMANELRKAGAL